MNSAHNFKTVAITPPGAIVDNAAYTTAYVDTLGFKHATIYVLLGATDVDMAAAMKVQECDTSGGSYVDITGASITAPTATDDDKLYAFDIALDGTRKRYLDLVATAGDGTAGTYLTSWVVLSRAEAVPSTAAGRGITGTLAQVV